MKNRGNSGARSPPSPPPLDVLSTFGPSFSRSRVNFRVKKSSGHVKIARRVHEVLQHKRRAAADQFWPPCKASREGSSKMCLNICMPCCGDLVEVEAEE